MKANISSLNKDLSLSKKRKKEKGKKKKKKDLSIYIVCGDMDK